ncbi:hypothetical protein PLANPX_4842 [Lacipirellula parvula]|uniref:Uncharacterized protein n=1 Tax=Lacipirellula parvula TaxID=2650471 RepID=A0A5K7XEK5_9BACT|nr:hypothetical protein PLANPX_4842 [Lacipirellula parvula]
MQHTDSFDLWEDVWRRSGARNKRQLLSRSTAAHVKQS